jgi:hypothetical protein
LALTESKNNIFTKIGGTKKKKGYDSGFPKNSKLSINFWFEKKNLVQGRCVQDLPWEIGPWIFLVPPILLEIIFLDSVRTKISGFGVLS